MSKLLTSCRDLIRIDTLPNLVDTDPTQEPDKLHLDTLKEFIQILFDKNLKTLYENVHTTLPFLKPKKNTQCMVMVLCGGKCGSTALFESFSKHGIDVIRIHNMDHFVEEYAPFLKGVKGVEDVEIRKVLHPDDLLRFFLKFYRSIVVVDSYRDPLERKLSSFFQNFSFNLSRMGKTLSEWESLTFKEQVDVFEKEMMPLLERRHGLDTYYPTFFQNSFDFVTGMQQMAHPHQDFCRRVRLVKVRFSDIHQWGSMFSKLFGWPLDKGFTILPANESRTKEYAELYSQWKQHFHLKEEASLIDSVFDPVFFKYHSPEEMMAYYEKWRIR